MSSRYTSSRPCRVVFRIPSKDFDDPTSKVLKQCAEEKQTSAFCLHFHLALSIATPFLSADYCAWAVFDLGDNYGYVAESYGVQMIPL